MTEPRFAFATETRDKNENQDGGVAERLLMADGGFAYLACVADGVSQCESPREVSAMALSALRRAIEDASAETLADASLRAEWVGAWSRALADAVRRRVSDGFSTLCALVLFELPAAQRGPGEWWGLVSINVGDSQSFLVSPAREGCASLRPPDGGRGHSHPGGGLARAVGMAGTPLLDISFATYPQDFTGWFWVGSDGVFNFVMGSDLREFCLVGVQPFRKLPNAVLDLSLSEGRASRRRKLDNATVALLGLNVPEGAETTPDAVVVAAWQKVRARRPRRWPRVLLSLLLVLAAVGLLALLAWLFLKSDMLPAWRGIQPVPDQATNAVGQTVSPIAEVPAPAVNSAVDVPPVPPASLPPPVATIQITNAVPSGVFRLESDPPPVAEPPATTNATSGPISFEDL